MAAPIAITLGDPAGIGPEIIARAWMQDPQALRGCVIAGDVAALQRAQNQVARGAAVGPLALLTSLTELPALPPRCLPVLQVARPGPLVTQGVVSPRGGQVAADCVLWAAQAALRGEVAALVTAPLHKEALALAGPPADGFPGHTELLQHLAARYLGRECAELPVRMMLANDELRVVLVSIHLSLREALDAVTRPQVLETLRIAHRSLSAMLGRAPRLAVAGLNPHAGEGGRFGREELEVIAPAIAAAREEGISAQGPFPPDTVFMRARAQARAAQADGCDAVIAMYHDQGLIPLKYLGVEQGVNVTLGLPLVRTSPDHVTAFDIAGTGQADPSSLLAAVRVARTLSAADCP
ncbi:MAG: 4-hydroxythreonine-4-phosphate dehydrogenase PdxA [Rhodoferax sp.]|nr:4-hydroxythreonine-4-phosphate dehydrogenase PdxA [Rhodoferax sp.]